MSKEYKEGRAALAMAVAVLVLLPVSYKLAVGASLSSLHGVQVWDAMFSMLTAAAAIIAFCMTVFLLTKDI